LEYFLLAKAFGLNGRRRKANENLHIPDADEHLYRRFLLRSSARR
jgi:hypothetical protein